MICDHNRHQCTYYVHNTYSNYLCTPSNSGHIFGEAVTLFCLGEHVSVHYAGVHFDHNKLSKLLAIGHEELVHSQILGPIAGCVTSRTKAKAYLYIYTHRPSYY